MLHGIASCGLYDKHIMTIVSDDLKWSLYYERLLALALG